MSSLRILILFWNFIGFSLAITRHCHNATGRCYWMSTAANADWATARANCQSDEGDLAVMETQELWDFVTSTFR